MKWLASVGLGDYANNIKFSGIHGALFVLDQDFNHSTLSMCLQVPTSNSRVCVVKSVHWLVYILRLVLDPLKGIGK